MIRWSAAILCLLSCACVVTQPRGSGRLSHHVEPDSRRAYWLYVPRGFDDGAGVLRGPETPSAWPLVLTLHGMKPFDSSWAQACEWQTEADRYGFVVVAPDLLSPDVLEEFPVRRIHPAFFEDEQCVLAIVDEVRSALRLGCDDLLVTGWSSGGYLAHFLLNRHPQRITCLAARQANFSAGVLDETRTPQSAARPVLIVNTEHDVERCIVESRYAVAWYQSHGTRALAWLQLRGRGHERTPELAAAFYAESLGCFEGADRTAGREMRRGGAQARVAPVLRHTALLDGNEAGRALMARFKQRAAATDGQGGGRTGS